MRLFLNLLCVLGTQTVSTTFWRLLSICRIKEHLLRIQRKRLIADVGSPLSNRLSLNAFSVDPFPCLSNRLEEEDCWIFNEVRFKITTSFLDKPMDKNDYTHRMVFFYLEWLYKVETEEEKEMALKLLGKIRSLILYQHPSCMSLRVYPLLCFYTRFAEDKEVTSVVEEDLRKTFRMLIFHTEEENGANHLLDNYMVLTLLSLLFGSNENLSFFSQRLIKFLAYSTANGFFAEKNPVYERLLSHRLKLLRSALQHVTDDNSFSDPNLNEELDRFDSHFQNHPDVHFNDVYLPLGQLKNEDCQQPAPSHSELGPYFATWRNKKSTTTVLLDPMPRRGFTAHAHECAGSLFIYQGDSVVMGAMGTPSYANRKRRMLAKRVRSYPVMRSLETRSNHMLFFNSFRIAAFFRPRHVVEEFDEKTTIHFSHRYLRPWKKKLFSVELSDKGHRLIPKGPDTNFGFEFYSDLKWQVEESVARCEWLEITGFETFQVKNAVRYDGIYRNLNCSKCSMVFTQPLEIRFL